MSETATIPGARWYTLETQPNRESQVCTYLKKFIPIEEMEDYIFEVLVPVENVTEIKNGKKTQRQRKFYPRYVFVYMRLYDEDGKLLHKPWYFIRNINGVIHFVGKENPVPLKDADIERIKNQVEEAAGRERPKIQYEVGEEVKITDGPFLNLSGRIDEIDEDRGKLKVSVSIFGRFTPVELEYWQVEKITE
jgi:transcriptional antiterminator NusG